LSNDYQAITGRAIIPSFASGISLRAFLPAYGWTLGFIGAHVFRRDRFAACEADGFGTYFHHLMRLLRYVHPDDPLGFIAPPLVGNRADDESTASWSGDRLAVVFGLEKVFSTAMRDSYSKEEIEQTVNATRRSLGYRQFFRLLYWAALAERAGDGRRYWDALARLVPRGRYARLRSVPQILYPPLMGLIPIARRTKRYVSGLGFSRK
jgi:hypothetical protein